MPEDDESTPRIRITDGYYEISGEDYKPLKSGGAQNFFPKFCFRIFSWFLIMILITLEVISSSIGNHTTMYLSALVIVILVAFLYKIRGS